MAVISEKQQQLVDKLKELFMMDQADLNFGIYRVMNAKHDEIECFLHNDLLSTIHDVLQGDGKESGVQKELNEAIKNAQSLGVDPDAIPKVQELKELLGDGADNGLEKDENEIFSQLTTFFSRYYDGGDFMSLRRYKKETYSPLPMNGEEVKLHWANADQYYIKSAENFSHYAFKIGEKPNQKHICFELVDASTEQNNVKATEDKERRFVLNEADPISLKKTDDGEELLINFSYQADAKKRSQKDLNQASIKFITELEADDALLVNVNDWITWQTALLTFAPTEKNKKRTILEKHLNDYTAKNSFDYFIHKDLGGFMRRELDFFIKNELLLLDDIVPSTVGAIDKQLLSNERSLKKVIAFKIIAQKLIAFLAQLENFQKTMWLKKKFVLETNYCMTLDRVPEHFYADIVANEKQIQEWQLLGFIESDTKITEDYLKENPYLLIDTGLFELDFKQKLLAEIDNLDEATDGLLVHSDNFQALNLLQERYREKVGCIHIDPPYNTETSGFLYKNAYQHSSWLSMMSDRLSLATELMSNSGDFICHIDENEYERLNVLFDSHNLIPHGTIIWDKKNPMLGRKGLATQHEYIIERGKEERIVMGQSNEILKIFSFVDSLIKSFGLTDLEDLQSRFRKWLLKQEDLSGGDKAYKYLDEKGGVYRLVAMGAPEKRQDEKFHIPLRHPGTGNDCPVPPNGWSRTPETLAELMENNQIVFGVDDTTQPQKKVYLRKDAQKQLTSVYRDGKSGKGFLDSMGLEFPYCHPVSMYEHLLSSVKEDATFMDFFAGSGTNGHAVINISRKFQKKHKSVLVEMGDHFDKVLKPRIKKAVYSENWKNGKPLADKDNSFNGISHSFKTLRLESYEDVMDNLKLQRSEQQSDALAKSQNKALKEDYLLHYMLDVEAKESLLPANLFIDPFNATMRVVRDNEARKQSIDLVETFNYLLGLRIKTIRESKGIVEVTGISPNDQMVLILWRNTNETDNDTLDEWFKKQSYNSRDMEFNLIYVNGDNNLPNLRQGAETWKVQLIDETFQTLMFDVKDV